MSFDIKGFYCWACQCPISHLQMKLKVANKTVSEIHNSLLSAIFQQNPKFILSILNHCMHFFKSWWQEHFSNLQLLHKSIYISILVLFLLITLNHSWDFHCVKIIHLLELFSAGFLNRIEYQVVLFTTKVSANSTSPPLKILELAKLFIWKITIWGLIHFVFETPLCCIVDK